MIICSNEKCQTEFLPKQYNQVFCSDRCRNQKNKRKWIKNHKKPCSICGNNMSFNAKICQSCRMESITDIGKETTLKEYQNMPSVVGKHPSWKNAHIRNFVRSWNKDLRLKPCQKCGYSLHVELCHIKPLSKFSPESTLGEINHPNNIFVLCRNCHWELDHGFITVAGVEPA